MSLAELNTPEVGFRKLEQERSPLEMCNECLEHLKVRLGQLMQQFMDITHSKRLRFTLCTHTNRRTAAVHACRLRKFYGKCAKDTPV